MSAREGIAAAALSAAALDLAPFGLFAIDRLWRVSLWNGCLETWTGIRRGEALGRDLTSLVPALGAPRYMSRIETLFAGSPPVVFSRVLSAELFGRQAEGGRRRLLRTVAMRVPEAEGVLFAVEDQTEVAALLTEARKENALRKATELKLRASMRAQEILAHEASHRIKNNLSMVASLIEIERAAIADEAADSVLESLVSRIESIALIHEQLYLGELGSAIPLEAYLKRLCRGIFSTLLPSGSGARLELELEPMRVAVDKCVYVGIMAAELLTNAIKYAIAPRGRGLVRVSARRAGPGRAMLEVADDGPGFGTAEPGETRSMGKDLVRFIAGELGAELERGPGLGIDPAAPGARISVIIAFEGDELSSGSGPS